ncbi:MAG: hypothetical protein QXD03_03125 [Candidatus Anstonellales archaeon]
MISSNIILTFCVIDSSNSPRMINMNIAVFSSLNDSDYMKNIVKNIFDRYNSKMMVGSGNLFNLKFKPIHKVLVDDYVVESPLTICNYIAKDILDSWDKVCKIKITNLSTDPNITYIYNKDEN